MRVNVRRVRTLNTGTPGPGPVVYWMSRDQRIQDNWALIHAQDIALQDSRELQIVFCLVPSFLGATLRQYDFMLKGLKECARQALQLHIPFQLLLGDPGRSIGSVLSSCRAHSLVMDFDPLPVKRGWKKDVSQLADVPVIEVDAHNVVPCWEVSGKQEYAARTIRPKIHRQLMEYLEPFPELKQHPHAQSPLQEPDWTAAGQSLNVDRTVGPVDWIEPGTRAGMDQVGRFVSRIINDYDQHRNDPNARALSNLSPYLHFGQIAPQRAAFEAWNAKNADAAGKEAFLEELVVRRELSENFCAWNHHPTSLTSAPDWGRRTLNKHARDPRPYLYSYADLEEGQTHDPLWNAAQMEMVKRGKMHGYLRMYWAKKILEWSEDPEQALKRTIELNDRYELDGRDPNGYVGALWAIGGLHDRPFQERSVFGQIRYMSHAGCKRKFDVDQYVQAWTGA